MSKRIEELKGKTITQIDGLEKYSEEVSIITSDNYKFILHHIQDCCESVCLEDYDIEAEELKNAKVINAYLETNHEEGICDDSCTWSFYRIVTDKGTLFMRWLGQSNGYYSEDVDLTIREL